MKSKKMCWANGKQIKESHLKLFPCTLKRNFCIGTLDLKVHFLDVHGKN
jgi:hypothetical protein